MKQGDIKYIWEKHVKTKIYCNNKASSSDTVPCPLSFCVCGLLGTQHCQTNCDTLAEVLLYQLSTVHKTKEKRSKNQSYINTYSM